MKLPWRRISTAASLVVLLALTMLWIRGLWVRDRVAITLVGHQFRIESFPHHVVFIVGQVPGSNAGFSTSFGIRQYPPQPRHWEVRYQRLRGGARGLGIPHWLPVMLLSALPTSAALSLWARRRRYRQGLCARCGYDLRASTERCPECGESIVSPPVS